MGLKKNSPGCTCCGGCQLLFDSFERADSTDIGSNWTETAGDWEIAGGNLVTSDSNAFAECNTTPPANNGVLLEFSVIFDTSGDQARAIVNYQDSNNYNYVQIQVGSGGHIRIYERAGGVDTMMTEVSTSLSVGTPIVFQICYYNGLLVVNQGSEHAISVGLDGGSFGLGTGTIAGTVEYESFTATATADTAADDCAICFTCNGGCIGQTPGSFEVVCSGIGGFLCSSGNGTFILENPECVFGTTTRWRYGGAAFPNWELLIADNGPSGSPRRSIRLDYNLTISRRVEFRLNEAVASEGYDCPTISGMDIPFTSAPNCGAGVGTPTATLTAL